jgi:uncharacterized protein (DUF433 family)
MSMKNTLLNRITVNPQICHGKPTIRESRYMVESILEYLSAGDTVDDVVSEFPDLERDDVLACLVYATEVLKFKGTTFSTAA